MNSNPLISPKAKIGRNVIVGPFTIIHDRVIVGDNTLVGSHCVLGEPTPLAKGKKLLIGAHSLIRSHSVFYEGSAFGPGLSTGHFAFAREGTKAGRGLQIGNGCNIQGDCVIGDYVKMHSEVHVGKGARIGHFVYLYPKVQFTNDPFPPSPIEEAVIIQDMAVVATGTLLMPGIKIERGAFVSAGSVVRKNVPAVHCVSGDPAEVFCRLDQFFHLKHGFYHPWARRFREKYPRESYALMNKIIGELDILLMKNKKSKNSKHHV